MSMKPEERVARPPDRSPRRLICTGAGTPVGGRRAASGTSLIEVMIAIVVVGIGLLGIAAIQIHALQSSKASYDMSITTIRAMDLVERLWAAACLLDQNPDERGEISANILEQWLNAHGLAEADICFIDPDEIIQTPPVCVPLDNDYLQDDLHYRFELNWTQRSNVSNRPLYDTQLLCP